MGILIIKIGQIKFVSQLNLHMNEQMDYEQDVEKLKQVWGEDNAPNPTESIPQNLQTIDSNRKTKATIDKNKKRHQKIQNSRKKPQTRTQQRPPSNKKKMDTTIKTVFSNKKTNRNPQPNSEQVIEIATKPKKFYPNRLQNERNNIVKSQLLLNNLSVSNDKVHPLDYKKLLQEKDYELSLLRVSNSRNQDRIRYLERQIETKNQLISQLRNRERKLLEENCDFNNKELNFDYGKVEYENFKNDSRRLLKMLRTTQEYKNFAQFALDDDGVRFLHKVNQHTKSQLDTNPSPNVAALHFCTCNKAFIPQSGFWVPQKIYSLGKQFIKQRKGDVTEAQLELLLYELNRLWRQREKRIINSFSASKAHQVGKYKRKLLNLSREGHKTKRNKSVSKKQIAQQ